MCAIFTRDRLDHCRVCAPSLPDTEPIPQPVFYHPHITLTIKGLFLFTGIQTTVIENMSIFVT
jgi:hypothetical protein